MYFSVLWCGIYAGGWTESDVGEPCGQSIRQLLWLYHSGECRKVLSATLVGFPGFVYHLNRLTGRL